MINRTFKTIETNGVKLRVVVEGKGPLVILLHGWPQCWYLWHIAATPAHWCGRKSPASSQTFLATNPIRIDS